VARTRELAGAWDDAAPPSDFRPAWWLPSAHLQTVWAPLVRRVAVPLRRERLELADGDFVDLDWVDLDWVDLDWVDDGWIDGQLGHRQESLRARPRVLCLHGLEGSSRSPYLLGMLAALARRGWRGVALNFRGCSGESNRLERSYHSGETGDLDAVVRTLRARAPASPLAVVGFSLGGNVLLKWLGERGSGSGLAAAVAVSAPMVLEACAQRLERGLSRFYQWWLLRALRAKLRDKFRAMPAPVPLDRLASLRTFRAFDDAITAPLHGFVDSSDYYRRASSRPYLARIRTPTLIVHARDDPFMNEAVVPAPEELSPAVTLELTPHGGHIGFVSGSVPGRPRYWLETRISAFLARHLACERDS